MQYLQEPYKQCNLDRVKNRNKDLLYVLSHPIHVINKDHLPLWRFMNLKSNAVDKSMNSFNEIWAQQLEYDNGENDIKVTIDEFREKYSEFAYALYTSPSSTPERNKFRIILPLDQTYKVSDFINEYSKLAFINMFPGIDKTSISNWQRVPGYVNADNYAFYINKGRRFSYSDLAPFAEAAKLDDEIEYQTRISFHPPVDNVFLTDGPLSSYKAKVDESMEKVIRALPSGQCGQRYQSFLEAMGKLLNCHYPDGNWVYSSEECRSMLRRVYWDARLEHAFRNFTRKRR